MDDRHALAMALRLAYLSMHRQTNAHLARLGVTADQFVCLAVLAERDGVTQQELARRAASDPNTIRAMLVLLEKRGFLARRTHPSDRRARRVTLTRAGRRAFGRMLEAVAPLQGRLAAPFSEGEAAALIGGLDRIVRAMAG
jgi:DNA-binding MarR family transcriptional regulator